ncbi:hypothetical protein ACYZT8_09295 [Pseudomonas sp. LB3P93]
MKGFVAVSAFDGNAFAPIKCTLPAIGAVSVAAAELREAAFGDAVVVKSASAVRQENRIGRVYDDCVAERSLAQLGSCYRGSRSAMK